MELIRRASIHDAASLRVFDCDARTKWVREVQRLIRTDVADALDVADDQLTVLVAEDEGTLVGMVAYAPDELGNHHIYALAVIASHRRRGIGTRLKRRVLAETGTPVVSSVHRMNMPMLKLNETLNAQTARDPADGEFQLTVVRPPI